MRLGRKRLAKTVLALATIIGLSACAGGGSSDVVGESSSGDGEVTATLNLFAYAVPKTGFDVIVPAFQETEAGQGVEIQQSYGASGDQSRKVAAGAEADIVNFSVEPDVTRLVDAGLVDPDWNTNAHHGVPFGSVVTIVVREGNPHNIQTWDDLLQPDLEVVTPNPFSSGSAKWNLLAPYTEKSNGGQDKAAGLAYLDDLITNHMRIQPKSGREATEAFLQGAGDVLLSYENEALFIERKGDPVEHVTPPVTFRIDNPAAALNNSQDPEAAQAFIDYLYTPEAQELWAQQGFRPVDPEVLARHAADFPEPEKLWTIDDLGGWQTVNETLFAQGTGEIAAIYDKAAA